MVQLSQLQWYWYLFNKTYEFINSHLMQLCIQAISFPRKLRNLLLESSQFGPEKKKIYIEQLLVSCIWYTLSLTKWWINANFDWLRYWRTICNSHRVVKFVPLSFVLYYSQIFLQLAFANFIIASSVRLVGWYSNILSKQFFVSCC